MGTCSRSSVGKQERGRGLLCSSLPAWLIGRAHVAKGWISLRHLSCQKEGAVTRSPQITPNPTGWQRTNGTLKIIKMHETPVLALRMKQPCWCGISQDALQELPLSSKQPWSILRTSAPSASIQFTERLLRSQGLPPVSLPLLLTPDEVSQDVALKE